MKKKYKDTKLRLHFAILGTIIILTFFLSIGYATFESITLDISGNVTATPQSEIFISNVQYNENVNADIEKSVIHNYYQTVLNSTVVLGNTADSSVKYTITMYNNSDENYIFNSLEYIPEFYDNLSIVCELEGVKQGDLLPAKQQIVFSIKFHYLDNIVQNNNILNSYLNLKFIKESRPNEISDINNISEITADSNITNISDTTVDLNISNMSENTVSNEVKENIVE